MLDHLQTIDNGVERSTGCLPRRWRVCGEVPLAIGSMPVYGDADKTPIIPRSEWQTQAPKRSYEYRDIFQNGYPSCCPCATSRAIELLLAREGRNRAEVDWMKAWQTLAPRGGGVPLDDAIQMAMTAGFPVKGGGSVVVTEAFDCPTFEAVASSLLMGYPVTYGYFVPGGHAECAASLIVNGSKVQCDVRNSWGLDWGDRGWHIVDESAIARGIATFGAFAIREVQLRELDTAGFIDAK